MPMLADDEGEEELDPGWLIKPKNLYIVIVF